jgi:hypothetical protein
MTKICEINIIEKIDNCGECFHDLDERCELTGDQITEHWEGILDTCPLPDNE